METTGIISFRAILGFYRDYIACNSIGVIYGGYIGVMLG